MKHKKIIWIISIAVLILAVIAAVLLFNKPAQQSQEPQNLGPELEYIGKTEYGCFLICDAPHTEIYYFGTNITEEELKIYFTNATFMDDSFVGDGGEHYSYRGLRFTLNKSTTFFVNYYDNAQAVISENNLKNTKNKSHVISVDHEDYELIKKAL